MKGIRGIIYDCDGVLFESRKANLAYYNAVLSHFEESPVTEDDRERAHLCHTAASPRVFEVLLGSSRRNAALEHAATIDYRRFIPYMTPEPEMAFSLSVLARKMPLAVATNRGTSMQEILEQFDLARYFRAVVTSRDVRRPKPHPDMLHLAASRLELKEHELLFVGDSELDRAAARAAGIRFAAYGGGVSGDIDITGHAELVSLLAGEPNGEDLQAG